MSLDADYRKIYNYLELYADNNRLHPKWETIVLMTMSVGIGEITLKNVDEFWERVDILQAVDGPFLRDNMAAVWITREDIQRMVGLKTNVFPKESKAAFMKKVGEGALRKAIRRHKERELPAPKEEARG